MPPWPYPGPSPISHPTSHSFRDQNKNHHFSRSTSSYYFGASVTIYGDILAVGSWGESSNSTGINGQQEGYDAPFSGAAYVFTRSGSSWSQEAFLKASNAEIGDGFGIGLSLYNQSLAVGAGNERSNATGVNGDQENNDAQSSGAVYVYH